MLGLQQLRRAIAAAHDDHCFLGGYLVLKVRSRLKKSASTILHTTKMMTTRRRKMRTRKKRLMKTVMIRIRTTV